MKTQHSPQFFFLITLKKFFKKEKRWEIMSSKSDTKLLGSSSSLFTLADSVAP